MTTERIFLGVIHRENQSISGKGIGSNCALDWRETDKYKRS